MLKFFVGPDGLLLARAAGWNNLVQASFRPTGLRMMANAYASLDVGWDGYLPPISDRPQNGVAGWSVTFTKPAFRYVPRGGVSIRLHGDLRSKGRRFRRRTTPIGRRLSMLSVEAGRHRIPLSLRSVESYDHRHATDEPVLLAHLAWVLRDRRDLRARLVEPERVERLVAELNPGRTLAAPRLPESGSRDVMHVRVAMAHCGFHHRFGRPLTQSETRPLVDVVDPVLDRLATSSDRRVRSLGRSWVEEVARVDYIDVEPWPFSSLVD